MLVRGRSRPTYSLNFNPQIRFWHHRHGHVSNTRVIQVSKLVDGINFREKTRLIDDPHFFNFELEFDSDSDKLFPINKTIKLNIDSVKKIL